ncbi:aldo/keto reductase [Globicatella sanguinis]
MNYKQLGNTDMKISELSFGTWAMGSDWGNVSVEDAKQAIHYAINQGVNFFDTADVYGMGKSEQILGEVLKERTERIYIATKFGRKDDFTNPDNYTYEKVKNYAENSLKNLGMDAIDLYQIHCPSTEILEQLAVFDVLEQLQKEGLIRYYGVSVETDAQGEFVLNNTKASSLQVIVNMLRQKPIDQMIRLAEQKNIGVLARVPLASGLLTGKYTVDSVFPENDHRNYNQNGEAFNVGETFGGLPFKKGIELANQLEWVKEERISMPVAALKWVIQQKGVTAAIPGFKNIKQVKSNLEVLKAKDYSDEELTRLKEFYWNEVHNHIRGDY